ncbi:MAG: lipid II:glycine glycyltransferase FemX [Propionibacteriaceae bacterium]
METVKFLEPTGLDFGAEWDARIAAAPDGGNMFQTFEFGVVKSANRWQPRYALVGDIPVVIHEKKIWGLGKAWYIPKGPCVCSIEQLTEMLPALQQAARQHGVVSLKIEPELVDSPVHRTALRELGFTKVPFVQPNAHTIVVDLDRPLDEIFNALPKKRRYDIRRAERDGVVIDKVDATPENLEQMWSLYLEVAHDHNLPIRDNDYMLRLWTTFMESGIGHMWFARVEGRAVAAVFGVLLGHKSTYKDGASVRERPVNGASHLLQWKVIEYMHEHGSLSHDLCGTPPSDQMDNKDHQYYGLGVFKSAFCPDVIDYVEAWEAPIAPVRYALYDRAVRRVQAKVQATGRGDGWH